MKIIVAGSENLLGQSCYKFIRAKLDKLTKGVSKVIVLSGVTKGAATHGEKWAYERQHTYMRYHPDYSKNGKDNREEMAKEADAIVFFEESGTTSDPFLLELAHLYSLKVRIIHYDWDE